MKNQASLQLKVVDSPINPAADPGHLILRANSLKEIIVTDENGASKKLGEGGAAGSSVSHILLVRPVSDASLFPKITASSSPDFANPLTVDPYANGADAGLIKAYGGTSWLDFPADGLGTPFDNAPVAVDTGKFSSLAQPFYIRYCWVYSDGTETNSKSTLYPSSPTPPNVPDGDGKIAVNGIPGVGAINFDGAAVVSAGDGSVTVSVRTSGNAGREEITVETSSLDENSCFVVTDANPGAFAVCDSSGKVLTPVQHKVGGGVRVDFSSQTGAPWTVSFITGSITEEQIQEIAMQMAIVMS